MQEITKVALDAMGGDNAPMEIVKGAVDAVSARKDIKVFLVGQEDAIKEELKKAYPADAARGTFDGPAGIRMDMIIPKPFDPRVVPHVARKVAEAAIRTNVAAIRIDDFDAYEKSVRERIEKSR